MWLKLEADGIKNQGTIVHVEIILSCMFSGWKEANLLIIMHFMKVIFVFSYKEILTLF
jgi:hypothetical protein